MLPSGDFITSFYYCQRATEGCLHDFTLSLFARVSILCDSCQYCLVIRYFNIIHYDFSF